MKKKWIALWLLIVLVFTVLAGCAGSGGARTGDQGGTSSGVTNELQSVPESTGKEADISHAGDDSLTGESQETGGQDTSGTPEGYGKTESDGSGGSGDESVLDKDGTYTTKDDVALYLHTYGQLPKNFMTKKEAKKLGWEGGSLERYAPGMCIGGDYFGNYEGILPDGSYHECDIDTLGRKSRGAKRIIYSDDGRIYYTEDHYESFELLYGEE